LSAARFFAAGVFAPGDVVTLAADDARKLIVVLRGQSGDRLEIVDSAGRRYSASLRVEGSSARAMLDAELAAPARTALRVTLAQGIPKGQKMDFVVEKATELGVARVVPFASRRTVGGGSARDGKVERWRRLAKSAAEQCGRSDVPAIAEPLDFEGLVAGFGAYDLVLVPWELAPAVALRERLPPLLAGARDVLVAIGPEGGFAQSEAEEASLHGAHLISLGSRIFRTETAGLVACAALLFASGDI
jgi:16S rRNA (uracil1498-N3)-methyltransferase